MNFKRVIAVYKKELKDSIRNKRVLYSTIIVPLIVLPILIGLPAAYQQKQAKKIEITPSNVMISGFRIPGFFEIFARSSFINLTIAKDPFDALKKGRIDLYLRVVQKEPPTVEIYYNPLSDASKKALARVKLIIDSYNNSSQGEVRTKKINILTKSVISPRVMAGVVMAMIIGFLIVFIPFTGAIAPGVDSIAGEKERKTLNVLLSLPISRKEILMGKLMNVATISLLTSVLTITGIYAVKSFLFTDINIGKIQIGTKDAILFILLLLMYILIASSVVIMASAFARTYREAQNYLTPIMIIIMLPLFFAQTSASLTAPHWSFYIPGYNLLVILKEALTYGINMRDFNSAFISNIVALYVLVKLMTKIFNKAILR